MISITSYVISQANKATLDQLVSCGIFAVLLQNYTFPELICTTGPIFREALQCDPLVSQTLLNAERSGGLLELLFTHLKSPCFGHAAEAFECLQCLLRGPSQTVRKHQLCTIATPSDKTHSSIRPLLF